MIALMALRAALAMLLLATVAVRIWFPSPPAVDMRTAVSAILTLKGFQPRLSPQGPGNALASVDIDVPGCGGIVRIMPVQLTVWEGTWLREALDPSASKRFVYVDGTWPDVDRIGMRLVWFKHKALSLVGMSRYVAGPSALLLVGPPGCRVAEVADWRMMWDSQALSELGLRVK
jgi:hypothetical protein